MDVAQNTAPPRPIAETPARPVSAQARPWHRRPWLVVGTLLRREYVRFIRQKHRIFGALGQPLIFLVILGGGLSGSFRNPGLMGEQNYFEYFFPGVLLMIIMFTAIFSTISIIEDRKEGFLQSVLVSPAPAWTIVLGKVLGGSALAVTQAVVVLLMAPLFGIGFYALSWLSALVFMILIALALTSLGHVIAWRMDSVQGYHALMSVALFPMLLLSGAFFPQSGATGWMKAVMTVNPLTYGLAALRHHLYLGERSMAADLPSLTVAAVITSAFVVAMLSLAIFVTQKPARVKS